MKNAAMLWYARKQQQKHEARARDHELRAERETDERKCEQYKRYAQQERANARRWNTGVRLG